MIQIAMKSKGAVDRSSILSLNVPRTAGNRFPAAASGAAKPARPADIKTTESPAAPSAARPVPPLKHPVQKGQKAHLSPGTPLKSIRACFGWNTSHPQCDVDVSAFLLGADGKVPGDSWFVFYGQTVSPDQSTEFTELASADREMIRIDLQKLDPKVKKIVFVLTINDAFAKKLNFGMIKDAYVRILDGAGAAELVSFQMTEYYSNVISMMIGEVYNHNGLWKFNAVGNGVAKDLEGLCGLYGVQVSH
ncbi:MAG TPA: tellurium resistance protein TerD [Lachnospiraceae bacterium]|nr:tellurium resistance protein TerD [Lachnospiraceae bacterium]